MLPLLPQGFRLSAYAVIGSTNDEAKALGRAGAAEGTLVWARRQEAGRGRRGRGWVSPEGNLYCSLLIRPDCTPMMAGQLAFVAALAAADAAVELLPPETARNVRLKWPNDVQVDGRKLAGILLESEPADVGPGEAPRVAWLVIGMGMNVLLTPELVDPQAVYLPTSLMAEGAAQVTVEAVLSAYAARLDFWLKRWRAEGFAPVRAAWLARCAGLNQPVIVRLGEGERHGIFAGIDESGNLLLDQGMAGIQAIAAGEVFFGTVLSSLGETVCS